ncbi:CAAX amino terminal protease family protein [Fagus crenata]
MLKILLPYSINFHLKQTTSTRSPIRTQLKTFSKPLSPNSLSQFLPIHRSALGFASGFALHLSRRESGSGLNSDIEDGGVVSLDWPAKLELKEQHGLDTTFLLVPVEVFTADFG